MRYAELIDEPWCARLALKTAPAVEPVSVAELQQHSRVDLANDAGYMAMLITASRQWVEQYLGRQLITATWTLLLDGFPPGDEFEIPRAPLLSVVSVKYLDADYTLQTAAPAGYRYHAFAGPQAPMGLLERVQGYSWPTTYHGEGVVQVEFTAGYGAAASDVPAQVRQAILMHAAEMYERREQLIVGTISSPVAITVERLLWPLRVL